MTQNEGFGLFSMPEGRGEGHQGVSVRRNAGSSALVRWTGCIWSATRSQRSINNCVLTFKSFASVYMSPCTHVGYMLDSFDWSYKIVQYFHYFSVYFSLFQLLFKKKTQKRLNLL